MKIYVINLARSTMRRERIERRLRKLRIDFQFVEAFDTAFLTRTDLTRYIAADTEDFTPGRP